MTVKRKDVDQLIWYLILLITGTQNNQVKIMWSLNSQFPWST